MGVQVDEAGKRPQAVGGDDPRIRVAETSAQFGDDAVAHQDVGRLAGRQGRRCDQDVTHDEASAGFCRAAPASTR